MKMKKIPGSSALGFSPEYLKEVAHQRRESFSVRGPDGKLMDIQEGEWVRLFYNKDGEKQDHGVHRASIILEKEDGAYLYDQSPRRAWCLSGNFSHAEKVEAPDSFSEGVSDSVSAQLG